MDGHQVEGTRLDEALTRLGYTVTEGPTEGIFKVTTPDGSDAGELTRSECWAYFRERHRSLFEPDPPIWDEERYGPFRLSFSGFCPLCGYGTFNGKHFCYDGPVVHNPPTSKTTSCSTRAIITAG